MAWRRSWASISRPEVAIFQRSARDAVENGHGSARRPAFVNLAGIGIDAHVASQFNLPANVGRGFVGYLRLGVRAIVSYVPAWYTITTGDVRLRVRAVLVVVANSVQYGNGAKIAPGARVDDGELDLVVVEEHWRIATFCRTPRLFTGSIARAGGCSIRRIRARRSSARNQWSFTSMGNRSWEARGSTPASIRGRSRSAFRSRRPGG